MKIIYISFIAEEIRTGYKEKIYAQKKIEQEIEAIIEQKFAEQAIEELDENLAEA